MDKLSKKHRNKNMRAVKSKGSKIETTLAKELWNLGLRYRKNDLKVFGKPDFTFRGKKLAVFVDSEFWHGKNWEQKKLEHKSNIDFWHKKIERNIERDKEVNQKLKEEGWQIIRFWGKEIIQNPLECAKKVRTLYDKSEKKYKN
jgi:DNA mismatch endonuclease Vsr